MRKLRLYGDAGLRKKSTPVEKLTAAIRKFAEDMIAAMQNHVGVGLAAPQVGRNLRMAVLYHPEFHPAPIALINPVILACADELTAVEEGCLSLPNLNVSVARPLAVRLRYMDLKGDTVDREFFDLLSRIVQHECDHLDGKMIVDHLDLPARLQFEAQLKKKRP